MQEGYSIRASQEAVALGLANITGGFFRAFPISGSLSRAALRPTRHARRVRTCALGAAGVIVRLAAGGGKVYAGPVPEVKQGPIGARSRLAERKPGGQDAAEIACRLAAR